MNNIRVVLTILLLLTGINISIAQDRIPEIERLLDSIRIEYKISAIAASVITPEKISYGVIGQNKIDSHSTVLSARSKFHLGSNTKAITVFIAMKMVEEKQIRLESLLIDVVPQLTGILPEYLLITLSDLLSHRAGIQPYTSGAEFQKLPEFRGNISERRKQFAQVVLRERPVQLTGGNKYSYSNAGYAIAALMLEKVSHKTYEELVDETFKSLGLDYFWGFPNKESIKNPWGHWNNDEGNRVALPANHDYKLMDYIAPAGDLSMDIIDYSKFVMMNIDGLQGKDNYLKAESYQIMHYGLKDYAYGWVNKEQTSGMTSFHDGSAGTYFCRSVLFMPAALAFVVMTNSADDKTRKGITELIRILEKKYKQGKKSSDN